MHEQGVVNVYAGEAPGLDLVTQSRDALAATALEEAAARGSALSIDQAIALSIGHS